MRNRFNDTFGDFQCLHCRQHVSTDISLSGVNNRNHCPYCLHSRHLDLYQAGDRLSACKGKMRPIALTLKRARKKYGTDKGELMLVHQCTECGKFSINRIAADDIADFVMEIFEQSLSLNRQVRASLAAESIEVLSCADSAIVSARLYGWRATAWAEPACA